MTGPGKMSLTLMEVDIHGGNKAARPGTPDAPPDKKRAAKGGS
jgi:hypothetical protein